MLNLFCKDNLKLRIDNDYEPTQLLNVTLNVSHIEDHKILQYQLLKPFKSEYQPFT